MKQDYTGLWNCIHCGYENYIILNSSIRVTKGLGVIPSHLSICFKCDKFTDLEIKKINEKKLIITPAQSYMNSKYDF